jgi:hypothetical protein
MAKNTKLFSDAQSALDNDRDLLTADELAKLEAEVEAEATDELKEQAKKSVKAKLKAEARRKKGLEEPQVEVFIDLAPYCDRLLIDNVVYLQGRGYTVRASLAAVLNEQMQATWRHQSEIDGKPGNFYQKARNTRFSMATGAATNAPNINTSQILRA